MKKIFFILFLTVTSLAYSANVYFDYDPSDHQPLDGLSYYSQSYGRACMSYHILTVSSFFVVDSYCAKVQYPDGHWSDWQCSQSGGWCFTQAGTYHIEGCVHVVYDMNGQNNYYMYSNILTFYVIDNLVPATTQNLSIGANPGNNLVKLTWTANSEYDLSLYEIWREVDEFGTGYVSLATTTNTSYVDQEMYYAPGAGLVNSRYKVRALDINSNYSGYSSEVSSRTEPMNKQSFMNINASNYDYDLKNFPNPFNPQTNITYSIKETGLIQLKVYNMLGKEIVTLVNEDKNPGIYSVSFDGTNLPSGIYICTMKADNNTKNQKLLLMK